MRVCKKYVCYVHVGGCALVCVCVCNYESGNFRGFYKPLAFPHPKSCMCHSSTADVHTCLAACGLARQACAAAAHSAPYHPCVQTCDASRPASMQPHTAPKQMRRMDTCLRSSSTQCSISSLRSDMRRFKTCKHATTHSA